MRIFGFDVTRSTSIKQTPSMVWQDKTIWADLWNDSLTGLSVTEATALNISTVYACNKVLSEDIASLPLHVYERTSNGAIKATNHPIYNLLHDNPNEFMTPVVFHELMQTYVNLWGNAYAVIHKDRNLDPVSFEIVHPKDVIPVKKNKLWYKVTGFKNMIPATDMIHILAIALTNEYVGMSPIIAAKEVFGSGLALQEFANRFFGTGANMSGILSTENKLTEEAIKRLREGFDSKYSGIDKSHKIAVLEQGLKFQRIGVEPEAAQFLESRRFSVEEIARWFRVPPHMIADLSKSSFSNIEQQSMNYVIYTLRSWLVRWEQEYNRKLFTPDERKKYFVQFNIDGLLRGDAAARAALYQSLYNISAISPNEIRSKENMNPYPGGDEFYKQLNMANIKDNGTKEQPTK